MPTRLRLTFNQDSDGSGELVAQVSVHGFGGVSSAWFSTQQLINFARQLAAAYPLPRVPRLKLEGGYWKNIGVIDQLHLGLEFYPIGALGEIVCQVRLAKPVEKFGQPGGAASMCVELKTTYVQLEKFARSLEQLAQGKSEEANLDAEA